MFLFHHVGLRGCTADVVIMEEAAHMDPRVFHEVVVPLFGVVNTAVLAISSPVDDQNFYSELLELKRPDGTDFFWVMKIGLACASCLEAGEKGMIINRVLKIQSKLNKNFFILLF